MSTSVKVCLASIILQLTFIIVITGGTDIKGPPSGMVITVGDPNKVSATQAVKEGGAPAPVVMPSLEKSLVEKNGVYLDHGTGTTTKKLFTNEQLGTIFASCKGNLINLAVEPVCASMFERTQLKLYWTDYLQKKNGRMNLRSIKSPPPTITGGTVIEGPPNGMVITVENDVKIVKQLFESNGKYYDASTGEEQATDPFHSVDSGTFIVADCGTRFIQIEGDPNKVSGTQAAKEGAPAAETVAVPSEEKTLVENNGEYEDQGTGTPVKSPFINAVLGRIFASNKGKLLSYAVANKRECASTYERTQLNKYWTDYLQMKRAGQC